MPKPNVLIKRIRLPLVIAGLLVFLIFAYAQQEVFFGKGQYEGCHQPPFYTDNLMHNL